MLKNNFVDDLNLPANYNKTNLALIARDPYCVFAYWEIPPEKSSCIIRMYDVTSVDFNGKNSNSSFDVNIAPRTNSRYINLPCDNVSYYAELGIITEENKFIPLAKSNFISIPRLGPSNRSDQISLNPPEGLPKKVKRIFLTDDDIRAYYSRIMPLNSRKSKSSMAKKSEKNLKNGYAANIKNSNVIICKEGQKNIFWSLPGGLESGGGSSGFMGGKTQKF